MSIVFYDGSAGISPLRPDKRSYGDLTATRMNTKERGADVQDAVEHDFTLHYRVTNTAEFLEKLLPVEKATVDKILQKMKDENLYDSQSRKWRDFQTSTGQEGKSKPKEKSLYAPFNSIAEAIRLAAEQVKKESQAGSSASGMGPTVWADYHSKSPQSHDDEAAQIRPDSLLALKLVADHSESNEFQNSKGKAAKMLIWWLQIVAAVEMKRSDSDNWDDLVKQLVGYLRRILREQLDRRFVFGLTLGPNMMTVWMHDRSGVIGTKTSINIHKDPAKFIQVIAAFSLLPPEKLGFDPTIKLLVSPNHAVPSYQPTKDFIEAYRATPYNRRWVITMNNGMEYVTVRTVSSVRAGFMRGRGTIAWVVAPYKKAKESKLYVLKQSWRPRDVDSEGKLYDEANGSECDYVGMIDLSEEVLISGLADTTDALIRQGLDDSTGPGKRSTYQRPEGTDPFVHVTCTDLGDIEEIIARDTGTPVSRVRSRVLLSTYGWLIKYFSTSRELLQVLRDAIAGHKHLYCNGVLHRDISPGNILIKWHPGSESDKPSTSGCLIDLDHAKKGKPSPGQVEVQPDGGDVDVIRLVFTRRRMETDVARRALEFFPVQEDDPGPAITYITAAVRHASKFLGLTQEQICTTQHLRWNRVKTLYNFDFARTECQKGSRTGTPPYTSGEILSLEPYFSDFDGHVFHDAVHDLESFFWVLVHICMTRQGPGGVRREELEQKNQENEEYSILHRAVFSFFDSGDRTMQGNKRRLFQNPNHLGAFVLDNFHAYFQTLRDPVTEWFHVLRLAHKFHAFEYKGIHDMVIEILDKALQSMPAEEIDNGAQKVLNDRKTDIEQLGGNPFGMVQNSPPPHTSPGNRTQVSMLPPSSPPSSPTPMPASKKKKKTGKT